ncbi:hypothetical protein KIN20_013648 [Parelaphostrongylus tenuis]|uniref:Uncharacterized protein n=1 Tax=Parelaphostrongylus tenuis TaxID=148309 RepID=A0AAD5MWF2_PARTN|nr:hypothetical protein KIN20_013648 [Parelaphostrongylus tenuis]
MARLVTYPSILSLLATMSAVLGCGVIPAGQISIDHNGGYEISLSTKNSTVTGFRSSVAMVVGMAELSDKKVAMAMQ